MLKNCSVKAFLSLVGLALIMLLTIDANAFADGIVVAPAPVRFGGVSIGSAQTRAVTVTNAGVDPITINSLAFDNAANLRISSETCTGQQIASSATCTVMLVYSPTSLSSLAANLIITSPDASNSPQAAALTGLGGVSSASVYVANAVSNDISVIDPSTNLVIATIPVGNEPRNLAPNPAGTRVYVPNRFSNSVSVINTMSNTVITTITGTSFNEPYALAVTPDGSEVWVANKQTSGSGFVTIISTLDSTVTGTIDNNSGTCFDSPEGIAMNPVSPRAYVANSGGSVCVLDTSARSVLNLVQTGSVSRYVVATPDGAFVYDSEGYKIKTADNTVASTGAYGTNMAITSLGDKIYAGSFVIHTADDSVDYTGLNGPYALTVLPGTNLGYFTDEYQVLAFDTTTDSETGVSIAVGDTPRAITSTALPVAALPSSLNFGGLAAGYSTGPRTITIYNTGTSALSIGTLSRTGSQAEEFSIQSDTCSNVTLQIYEQCALEIMYSPVSEGMKSAAVNIPISLSADPSVYPIVVPLAGSTDTVLGDAVDKATFAWAAGGSADWFAQTLVAHDGQDAAQSGAVGDSQSSWLETLVSGPAMLSFWWKVSSEQGYDFLSVYIDDVKLATISGDVDWQSKTYELAAGSHRVRWEYSKDGSYYAGADAGWVDQVEICAGGSFNVTPGSLSVPFTGGVGAINLSAVTGSCGWKAVSISPWITVTSGATGAGDGSIGISVAPGPELLGAMEVAGRTITVVRAGVGGLDTSFAAPQGYRLYNNGGAGSSSLISAATQTADGRVVAAGYLNNGANDDVLIMRFNADGTPDPSFGTDGAVIYNGSSNENDSASAIAVQDDGRIVVAGYTENNLNPGVLLLRLNANGTLDPSFGTNGVVTYTGNNNWDYANAVAVKADGRIVVAGTTYSGMNDDVLVLQFNADGTPDATFGANGMTTFGSNSVANFSNPANAVAVQQDGGIVVAGYRNNGTNDDVLVMRFNADGTPDPSFGTDGVVTINGPADSNDYAQAVAIQSDGMIVLSGISNNGADDDVLISRLTATGLPDASFNPNGTIPGMTTFNSGLNQQDYGFGLTLQLDGKILVTGYVSDGMTNAVLALRYKADGTPDAVFGANGVATFNDIANSNASARAVTIPADGKIAIVGSGDSSEGIGQALVMRLNGGIMVPDAIPPTISAVSPAGGETDIPVNAAITATFSEALAPATINDATFLVSNATGSVTYDPGSFTATFTPLSNLASYTTYTATVTTGVKDLIGNAMVSDYIWSFTTAIGTCAWNNGDGIWSVGTNWSCGHAPTAGDDVFITLDGAYTVTLDVDATVKTLTLGGTTGVQTLAVNSTLTLNEAGTVGNYGVLGLAGTLTGSGMITINGAMNWLSGTMSGSGSTTIAPGGILAISATGGADKHLDGRTLNNNGTMNWANSNSIFVDNGSVINNQSGANFNVQVLDQSMSRSVGTGGAFNNYGTITKTGGGTTNINNISFNNYGTINATNGNLSISSSYVNFGTAILGSPAGTGTGIINITSGFSLVGTNAVNIDIGGTIAGTQYDQVTTSGTAALGGALNVGWTGGYQPVSAATFTVMTYSSHTGTFSPVILPALNSGIFWNAPAYNAGSIVLSVEACPAITLSSLPTGTAGSAYNQTITASGSVASYTYAATNGALPTGLSLASNGTLSGTPSYFGAYNFTVTATDANGCAGSEAYTVTISNTACTERSADLVSWWQGEGNANDQMSLNHGTLMSGATATAIGSVGQAFSFDGTNYVRSISSSGIPSSGPITFGAWIKTDSNSAHGSNPEVLSLGGDSFCSDGGMQGILLGSGRYPGIARGCGAFPNVNCQANVDVADNQWHYIVTSFDGTNSFVYIDGALAAQCAGTDYSHSSENISLGGRLDQDSVNSPYNGLIDEAQIYSRALSAQEIADIYNTGSNGVCDQVSPTVISTSPTISAVNVSVNGAITATFSEALDPATIDDTTFLVSGATGSVSYDPAALIATFTTPTNLTSYTTYTATITTDVKDLAQNSLASAYTWTFTTGVNPPCNWIAGDGSWSLPDNWSCAHVPNSSDDDVFITLDGTYTVILDVDATVKTLTLGGTTGVQTFAVNNTLTLYDASTVGSHGVLSLASTLTGSGTITINGAMNWLSGTMSGSGITTIASGGILTISATGDSVKQLAGRTLNNNGTVNWANSSYLNSISVDSGSVVNNQSGANFNIQSLDQSMNGAGAFNNHGTITKSGGGTTNINDISFNNDGTINVINGGLAVTGDGTHTGTFNADSGQLFNFAGGTHNLNPGSVLTGAGTIQVNGTANVSSTSAFTGNVNITGTMNVNSDLSMNGITLSGALAGTGNITVTTMNWLSGTMSSDGSGSTTIPSGGILTISTTSGAEKHLDGRTLNNNGTMNWTNSNSIFVDNGSVINNQSGANFNVQVLDQSMSRSVGTGGEFNNYGTVTKSGGGTTTISDISFNNYGTISAINGTLSINSYANSASGILGGPAAAGTGIIDITSGFALTGTNAVNIDIGGTAAGTQYDQITTSGTAALGGALNVGWTGGYQPVSAATFTVMTYSSRTGTFSPVILPALNSGIFWNAPAYNAGSIVLSVEACPAITLSSLPTGTAGSAYNQTITASGSVASYTYAATNGALPTGLSLASNGTLSGTPSLMGIYDFTVTATDTNGCTGSQAYTVIISNTACIAPPAGLVSWWQGEGNANDQMSLNHGTLVSNVTFTAGMAGQAFNLNGSDNAVQIASPAGLPLGSSARTMMAWFKTPRDLSVTADAAIVQFGTASDNQMFGLITSSVNPGKLSFSGKNNDLAGATTLLPDTWYHGAVTYDGATVKLYVNGSLDASKATTTLNTALSADGLTIGWRPDTGDRWQGQVDEVQIYNRDLSASEIANIYYTGSNGVCDQVPPTVMSTSPANGAANVAVNGVITATFSEALDPATINDTTFLLSGVTGSVTYDPAALIATFTTTTNLASYTTYTATITTGVTDTAGNAMVQDRSWSFTTSIGVCTWTKNGDGNWFDGANWSCGHAPTAGDDVIVTLDDTYTVTLDQSATVNSLTLGTTSGTNTQTLSIGGNSLTVNGSSTIQLRGVLSTGSAANTFAGAFQNNGTWDLNTGCTSTTQWAKAGLTNNGTILMASGCGAAATLKVDGGLTNNAAKQITINGNSVIDAVLTNQGTITVNNGSLTLSRAGARHANAGLISLINNSMTVTQSGTLPSFVSSGTISIGAGQTFGVSNGEFKNDGGTLSGTGIVSLSATALTAQQATSIPSGLTLQLSGATVNGPGAFTNAGTLKLDSGNNTINANFTNNGGVSTGSVANTFAGAFQNNGTWDLNTGCTSATQWAKAGLTNNGTITMASGCGAAATLKVDGGLTNNAAKQITINLENSVIDAVLTNQGSIIVNSGSLTLIRAGARHTNSGLINLINNSMTVTQSGTLPRFVSSGTISIGAGQAFSVSGGSFTNASGGIVNGIGTLNVSSTTFSNAGAINPGPTGTAGMLSITGSNPLAATSALNIDLGGTTAGTQYDVLAVSGNAALNGALNVGWINSYQPISAATFTVMTYSSHTGTFGSVILPALNSGKYWKAPAYNAGSVVLSVQSCQAITLSSLPAGTAGSPYNQTITASGGTAAYSYAMTGGTLPAGLTLAPNGTLSGTPLFFGTYLFIVTATDANICMGSKAYTITISNTVCIAPSANLVSWWQGEGNANDQMSLNHGTLVSNVTFTTGMAGQAFNLNGSDNAVQIVSPAGLPLGSSARTMMAWFKTPRDLSVTADAAIVQFGTASNNQMFGLITSSTNTGKLYFSGKNNDLAGATTLLPDTWYHGAVTYDGATVKLYVNGSLDATKTTTALNTVLSADGLTIGWRPDTGDRWQGQVDEVQIYNRDLSASEIANIYYTGSNGVCDQVPPTVMSTSPANGALSVSLNGVITATFSEALDPATIVSPAVNFTVNNGDVAGMVAYDAQSMTAVFTPSSNLTSSTTYTATIITGVKDLAQNSLASAYTWTFTTLPPHTITATAGPNGSITPSGAVSVDDGGSQTFTIIPSAGYSVATVTAGLVSQGSVTSYTFSNVTADHTIDASFVDNIAPTGSVTINGGALLTNTTSVTLTLTCSDAGSGCSQMQISNDGSTWSGLATYSTTTAWNLNAGEGLKTVYARFTDVDSNLSTAATLSITLDTVAPVISLTSPSANARVNTAQFGYTLGEAAASGTVTYQWSGGTTDSNQTYTMTASDLTTGSHSVTPAFSLVNGAIYNLVFTTTDAAGNATTPVTNANITFDTATAVVTLNSPAGGSRVNTADASYTLSETIASGQLVYTRTSGTADASSPHTYDFIAGDMTAGLHSLPTTSTGILLVDGAVYDVSIQNIVDLAGNSSTAVANSSVTFDSTAVAVTGVTPLAGSRISTAQVAYSLSEQAASGTISFLWTGGTADTDHIYTLSGSELASGLHSLPTTSTGILLVDGAVYSLVINAIDLAGNAATTIINAGITFDATPPTVSSVVPSNNATGVFINAALTATFSEAMDPATINGTTLFLVSGETGSITYDSGTFTATFTPLTNFATGTLYTAMVTTGVRDLASNSLAAGSTWSFTTVLSAHTITATAGPNGSITPSGSVIVSYGASQSFAIIPSAGYSVDIVTADLASKGSVTSYTFSNVTADHTIDASFIDITAPIGSVTINNDALFTNNSSVTLTLTCNDAGSGCSHAELSNDIGFGSAAILSLSTTTSTAWTLTSDDGPQSVYARFTDVDGNSSLSVIGTILLDKTPPVSAATPAGSTSASALSVSLTCNDGAGAGCGAIHFTVDNSDPVISSPTYTSPILVSGPTLTLKFLAVDLAGNVEAMQTQVYIVDPNAPQVTSLTPLSDSQVSSSDVSYTLNKDMASGAVVFSSTSGTLFSQATYTMTALDLTAGFHTVKDITLNDGTIYTLAVNVIDNASRNASAISTNVTYDSTAAALAITSPVAGGKANNATVAYTLSETAMAGDIVIDDGVTPFVYHLTGSLLLAGSHTVDTGYTSSLVNGGVYAFRLTNVKDLAGNLAATVSVLNVTFEYNAVVITNTTPLTKSIMTTVQAGYSFSDQAESGSLTFTRSGGNPDPASPHAYTMLASELTVGAHTVTPAFTLVDGTFYTVSFAAKNVAGIPAGTVSNALVFFDVQYGVGPIGNVDNTDGLNTVNSADVAKLQNALGNRPGDPKWNPVCDLDQNKVIDERDLMMLHSHYGETGP